MKRMLNQLVRAIADPARLSDAQLLAAFLADRSEPAFTSIVGRHGPMVLAACRRVLHHQQDAEDAVQTALVRLAGEPRLLAKVACPWAYLLRMVRNEVLVLARRKERCTLTGSLADLVTRCGVDEVEREESYRAVWSAIRTLPPEQAEVVVLKIWEELTFAQIAEILDASPNTVASRYQYAMAKLSQRLLPQRAEVHHD